MYRVQKSKSKLELFYRMLIKHFLPYRSIVNNCRIYFHFYEIFNAYYFIIVYYDRIAPYRGVVIKSLHLIVLALGLNTCLNGV